MKFFTVELCVTSRYFTFCSGYTHNLCHCMCSILPKCVVNNILAKHCYKIPYTTLQM